MGKCFLYTPAEKVDTSCWSGEEAEKMITTVILSIVAMAGLFLLLLSAVAFIQDKRFFTSAPKEIQAVIKEREERFPGAHALGWLLMALSLMIMVGAFAFGGWDGIIKGFTFWQFFQRFLTMLWLLKAFDILFFDLFLLCHSNFFSHFYPEIKEYVGPQQFGFNRQSHMIQIAVCPAVALLSAACTLLF